MSAADYVKRLLPVIERAARKAEADTKRLTASVHIGWQAYVTERSRLMLAASEVGERGTVKPDRWSQEMNRDEFEEYLLSLGVWVEEPDESD